MNTHARLAAGPRRRALLGAATSAALTLGALGAGIAPSFAAQSVDDEPEESAVVSVESTEESPIVLQVAEAKAPGPVPGDGAVGVVREMKFSVPSGCTPSVYWFKPDGKITEQSLGSGVSLDSDKVGNLSGLVSFTPTEPGTYAWRVICGAIVLGDGTFKATAGLPGPAPTTAAPPQVTPQPNVPKAAATVKKGVFKGAPKIKGSPAVGKWLGVDVSNMTPKPGPNSTYQWYANGKALGKASTAKTYKVTAKDAGKKIAVKLVAKKDGYTTRTYPLSKAVIVSKPLQPFNGVNYGS